MNDLFTLFRYIHETSTVLLGEWNRSTLRWISWRVAILETSLNSKLLHLTSFINRQNRIYIIAMSVNNIEYLNAMTGCCLKNKLFSVLISNCLFLFVVALVTMIFYSFMNCILVRSDLCRLIVTLFTFVSYSFMYKLLFSGM